MPIQLKTIINSFTPEDKLRLTNWNDRIAVARPFIFDFEYDLINRSTTVNTKDQFETLFLKKYYNREIGQSGGTVTAFKQDLEVFLLENVDRYNELLKSLSWEYDPMINFKMEEDKVRNVKEDNESQSTTTESLTSDVTGNVDSTDNTTTNSVELQVPQGMVNVNDISLDHASSSNRDISTGNTVTDSTNNISTATDSQQSLSSDKNKDETQTLTQQGLRGKSYQELVMEYRRNIINVLKMMIDEADVLFYQMYDY